MGTRGDLFFPVRQIAIYVPLATGISVFVAWLVRRPLPLLFYGLGTLVLALSVSVTFLPRVERSYQQTYWLGDARYAIPWQYDPHGGSHEPGGTRFLVRLSVPDLEPEYLTSGGTIVVGKATEDGFGPEEAVDRDACLTIPLPEHCRWREGDFIYSVGGPIDLSPAEYEQFLTGVADLLDSFEVHQASSE